jgi:hypothetical protein
MHRRTLALAGGNSRPDKTERRSISCLAKTSIEWTSQKLFVYILQPIQEDIMDKEENSYTGPGKRQPAPKPGETSQESKTQREAQAKSPTKPRAKRKRKVKPEVLITLITALITAITTIVVAWINAPKDKPAPTPTFTATPTSVATQIFTNIPVSFTDMPLPTGLPSWTNTPLVFPTTTSAETVTLLPRPKLIVKLEVNQTSGRKPLTVKLDARQSYLTDYGGQTYVCHNGACYYTWKVYSGGQQVGRSVTDSGGTFDYTFGKQGTYMVTVWVCRGRDGVDCASSGAQIIVTK